MQRRDMTREVVSAAYRPPELLLQAKAGYNSAVDLWSMGCIQYEVHPPSTAHFQGSRQGFQNHTTCEWFRVGRQPHPSSFLVCIGLGQPEFLPAAYGSAPIAVSHPAPSHLLNPLTQMVTAKQLFPGKKPKHTLCRVLSTIPLPPFSDLDWLTHESQTFLRKNCPPLRTTVQAKLHGTSRPAPTPTTPGLGPSFPLRV